MIGFDNYIQSHVQETMENASMSDGWNQNWKDHVANVKLQFPGRENTIDQIVALMGQPSDISFPTWFIWGDTATGKEAIIRALFAPYNQRAAYVHCNKAFAPRILFESLLDQLSGHEMTQENGFTRRSRCDTLDEFVLQLVSIIDLNQPEETRYIIIDEAEKLRDMDPHLLPTLTRLQELTNRNICTVLISKIVFDKFRTSTGFIEPLPIAFPNYNKPQVLQILQLFCPDSSQQHLFSAFSTIIYDAFQNSCKDLNELIRVTIRLWPKYYEPVQQGWIAPNDTLKLYNNIAPILRDFFAKLFLKELSSSELTKRFEADGSMVWTDHIDLPHRTRFLLMAAFIASYNKQTFDRKLFAKNDGRSRRKKTKAGVTAFEETGNKTRQQLIGPHPFSIERMMGIYYSIMETSIEDNIDVGTQIATLTNLRLLQRMSSSNDRLDHVKFKCNVSYEFIQQVALSVQFDLGKYLLDFA